MKTKLDILNEQCLLHGLRPNLLGHATLRIAVLKAMEEYRNQPANTTDSDSVFIGPEAGLDTGFIVPEPPKSAGVKTVSLVCDACGKDKPETSNHCECYEGVTWIQSPDPSELLKEAVKHLERLYGAVAGGLTSPEGHLIIMEKLEKTKEFLTKHSGRV